MDLGDKSRVANTIADAIEFLLTRPQPLFTPAFCLIAIGIDALSGGEKSKYIQTLKDNFPEMCLKLKPETFYTKYRSGMLHEYTPKKGFALTEDKEIGDVSVATIQIESDSRHLIALNVERLARDFITFARKHDN